MSKDDEMDKIPRKVDEIEKELDDIKEELENIEKEFGGENKIQEDNSFQNKVNEVKVDFKRLQKSSKEYQKMSDKSQAQEPKKGKSKAPQNKSKKTQGNHDQKEGDGLRSKKFALDSEEIESKEKANTPKKEKITEVKEVDKKEKVKKKQTKKSIGKKGSTKKKQSKKKKRSITAKTKFSSKIKIGVARFPGTNNEYEIVKALKSFGVEVEIVESFDPKRIDTLDGLWMTGGLSYTGNHRKGAIASVSAFMKEIIKEDKPILGVSDGFQLLTELKLLPGTIILNESSKFICDWIYITIPENNSYLSELEGSKLRLPIAHINGNLYAEKLKEVKPSVVGYYSNYRGNVQEKYNPNGSIGNIAGLGVKSIAALMPHLERASFKYQGSTDGRRIIEAFLHEVKR